MAKIVTIANVAISNITFDEAISTVVGWIRDRNRPRYVTTPNVDHIVRLQDDEFFREIYSNASLVLADGMPLLWAGRFLGTPLLEKVSGSDFFVRFCRVAAKKRIRLFFLGGNPGDGEMARDILMQQNPGLQVVGLYCPPFGFQKDESEKRKIVNRIRATGPDVLFVGLGAPKQEKWIYEYYQEIGVPVSIGIGIGFSLVAGTVKRAPVCMQKVGMEWLWRLMMEPRRLWKRYLIDDTKFFWLVAKQKLSRSSRK